MYKTLDKNIDVEYYQGYNKQRRFTKMNIFETNQQKSDEKVLRMPKAIQDIFTADFNTMYALAKSQGDKRFGSECRHENTKYGVCLNCQRRVK